MGQKSDNGKKWWLYGALASLLVAVAGVVLLLFVFNDKKARGDGDRDDKDEKEVVARSGMWFGHDDKDDVDERTENKDIKESEGVGEKDPPEESLVTSPATPPTAHPATPPTAQQSPVATQDCTGDRAYDVVEQQPLFPGEVSVWLGQNMHYPAMAEENGIQGTVVCQFVVEKDGSISNVTVLRSADPLLDAEAVRVIRQMPLWSPGMKDGQPVRVRYTLPISFKLQ